jgi:hypothetical protein
LDTIHLKIFCLYNYNFLFFLYYVDTRVELLLEKTLFRLAHVGGAIVVYDQLISIHPDDFCGYLAKAVMQLLLVASRLSVSSLFWFNFLLLIYLYSGLFLAAFISMICTCKTVAGCFISEFWCGCYVRRSNQLVLSFSLTQWGISLPLLFV